MHTYSMKCSCGDVMKVQAMSREEAVANMKNMMSADMVAKHMAEKHSGEAAPSVEQVHAMIEKDMIMES